MKIAFYLIQNRISKGNGVVSQALTWKKGLEQLGHEVTLCSSWEYYDLASYDAIQLFGFNENLPDGINALLSRNPNIFLAPVYDPDYGIQRAKLMAHYGNFKLRISSKYSALRDSRHKVKGLLVRSEFEKRYMVDAFGYSHKQCHIVKLPSGVTSKYPFSAKEDFCFHMSLLCDKRKNVKRLIDAAIKYNFKLVLAGGLRDKSEEELLHKWIGASSNIEYKGYISEEEKKRLFQKAKVFALPSLNEGVGIVALEAASYGADVVITKLGGPKEYYGDYALKVNPYNVDEIGKSIKLFMDGLTFQPQLAQFIDQNNSLETISRKLELIYNS